MGLVDRLYGKGRADAILGKLDRLASTSERCDALFNFLIKDAPLPMQADANTPKPAIQPTSISAIPRPLWQQYQALRESDPKAAGEFLSINFNAMRAEEKANAKR